MEISTVRDLLRAALPGAQVTVNDMTGTGDHFEIEVVSGEFEGQMLIERHRRLHGILKNVMESGALHAVKFSALTPAQKSAKANGGKHA